MLLLVISHNYEKIKVDSYDPLPLEKKLTFRNVITLIKAVFNKDKINYCYNALLEKVRMNYLKIMIINTFSHKL